jgi:hypothetical protein
LHRPGDEVRRSGTSAIDPPLDHPLARRHRRCGRAHRKAKKAGSKEPPEHAKYDLSVLAQACLQVGDNAAALEAINLLEKRFPASVYG